MRLDDGQYRDSQESSCVSGQVSQLIRISEGFHEKSIGTIADAIASRGGVRVICIAGPSSSGKTSRSFALPATLDAYDVGPAFHHFGGRRGGTLAVGGDAHMIRNILVALDASERAAGVFATAAEVAARFGATLHLFRVVDIPPEFPAAAAGSHADPLPAHEEAAARAALLKIAEGCTNVDLGIPIVRFAPQAWRAILRTSDELDVDLIVLGSHGYHGLDRILGTTAAKVANLAHRNVLVVHNREPMPSDRASSSRLFGG